ncbi:MAG: metal ABC transporter ATP-binding protein, partial [Verrucomicrobiota bacterium]
KSRSRVGYVPQREDIDWDFPVSVLDVVLMGRYEKMKFLKWASKKDKEIARQCLERVKMLPFADRQISQLSGGQQQRVFLARALAQESDLYLMDEPFAGVDAATQDAIIQLLREMREQQKTVFVVHHDLATVPEYFDWVILLNARLIAHGPTKQVFTPENLGKTYGGQLTVMAEVAEALRKDQGLAATSKH